MKQLSIKLFVIILISTFPGSFCNAKVKCIKDLMILNQADSLPLNVFLYGKIETFYKISPFVVSEEDMQPGKTYIKGFEILNKIAVDNNNSNRIKLVLVSKNGYLEDASRSCPFLPDFGFKLLYPEGSDKKDPITTALISVSCRKIFISDNQKGFTGLDGNFFDLSSEGMEAINTILEDAMNSQNEVEKLIFKNDPYLLDSKSQCDQLFLIERLIKDDKVETIGFLFNDGFFSILDSLSINKRKLMAMVIDLEGLNSKGESLIEDLFNNNALPELSRNIDKGIVIIKWKAKAAPTIDGLPESSLNPKYYLDQIQQILNNNKNLSSQYSLEDYLEYERNNNIISEEDQILSRTYFIEFLNKEARK